jgi:hypothetical protein
VKVPTNCSTRKSAQTEAEVAQKRQDQAKEKKLLKQLTPPLNKVLAGSCWEICFKSIPTSATLLEVHWEYYQ